MCSSDLYTEKVASLVQEAAYLQANLSGQEGDTVSAPISNIDGKECTHRHMCGGLPKPVGCGGRSLLAILHFNVQKHMITYEKLFISTGFGHVS